MNRDLAIYALKMTITVRSSRKGCIHQAECGREYCSHDYQETLRVNGYEASMRGKGKCHENAAV